MCILNHQLRPATKQGNSHHHSILIDAHPIQDLTLVVQFPYGSSHNVRFGRAKLRELWVSARHDVSRKAYLARMHCYTMAILVGKITRCFQSFVGKGKVVAVFSMGCEGEHLG